MPMGVALKLKVLMRPVLSTAPCEYVKLYPLLTPAAKTLSISPAAVEDGLVPLAGVPRYAKETENPVRYVEA
jgi:hypothetical protein